MLPVVRGIPAAARQIVAYSFILTGITLALLPVSTLTWGYAVVAGVLGLAFIVAGDPAARRPDAGAGDQALHVLQPVPRDPVRGHCRRHRRPLRLTPGAAHAPRSARSCWSGCWLSPRSRSSPPSRRTVTAPRARHPKPVKTSTAGVATRGLAGTRLRPPAPARPGPGAARRLAGQGRHRELLGVVVHPVPQGVPAVPCRPRRSTGTRGCRSSASRSRTCPATPARFARGRSTRTGRSPRAATAIRSARPTGCARSPRPSSSTGRARSPARYFGAPQGDQFDREVHKIIATKPA